MSDYSNRLSGAPITESALLDAIKKLERSMSEHRIEAIRARVAAASPGPWLTPDEAGDARPWLGNPDDGPDDMEAGYYRAVVDHEGCATWPWGRAEDMLFAYKARDDVPFLLALNAELLEALEGLVRELAKIDEGPPLDWDYSQGVRDGMDRARELIARVRGKP